MRSNYLRVRLCTCAFFALLTACQPRPELEIVVPKELQAGKAARVYLVTRSLPPSSRFIWQCDDGICDPQDTTDVATYYRASHPGKNHLVVHGFSNGREVIADSISFDVNQGSSAVSEAKDTPSLVNPAVPQTRGGLPSASSPKISQIPTRPQVSDSPAPMLTIKTIPPFSEEGGPTKTDSIAGTLTGERITDYLIIVYAKTNLWYVQPLATAPVTVADAKTGEWHCETHLGVQYAVLVVRPEYVSKIRPIIDELPREGGDVLDLVVVDGRKEPIR